MTAHVSDEQLSLLADGELSLVSRRAVLDHLQSCPSCAERHDALVDLVATLRLERGVAWSADDTGAVLERGRAAASRRDRALPLAAGLAFAVLVLGALSFPLIEAGVRVGFRLASTAAAVVSHHVGLSVAVVAAFGALALVAAAVTLPLARWR